MVKRGYNGLSALDALRTTLNDASTREVINENGHIWRAGFTFGKPATEEEIADVKMLLSLPLPASYEQFLRRFNGALLYKDKEYGQWGFHLYGTADLVRENERWRHFYDGKLPEKYLATAKSLGDVDLLLLDTAQQVKDGTDCPVIDGNADDPPARWKQAARSFSDWLDRLVVAQGAKYWRWY